MPYFNYKNNKIHYIDQGQGKTIILLGGDTASSALYKNEIEFFSKYYRIICPDYLGYGKSDRVKRFPNYFWWENAVILCDLIKSLKINECALIGSSGGGTIALCMAIIASDVITSVIADSICGEYITSELAKKTLEDRMQKTPEQCQFWEYAHGDDWEKIVDMDTDMIQRNSLAHESCFKERLYEIKCPVLITGSLKDDLIPDIEIGIRDTAKQINNSEIVLYSQGSHPLMWSRSDEFYEQSLRFLQKCGYFN